MDKEHHFIKELRSLLKKSLKGKLTIQESAYLKVIERTYTAEEWDKLLIDVIFELTAEEKEAERNIKKESTIKFSFWLQNKWLPIGAIAACLALFALFLIWRQSTPVYVFEEYNTCDNIPANAEISLSIDPLSITVVGKDSLHQIFRMEVGDTLFFGHTQLYRNELGSVFIQNLSTPKYTVMDAKILLIQTHAYQQIEVIFKDLGMFRLDAGTQFSFGLSDMSALEKSPIRNTVQILGQAWVQLTSADQIKVQGYNGLIQGCDADFVLRTTPNETRATIFSGELSLQSRISGENKKLSNKNQELRLRTFYPQYIVSKNGEDSRVEWKQNDEWNRSKLNASEIQESLTWTMTVRKYHNIEMRDFIIDMARWYGLKFENINCIPSNLKIKVEMCSHTDYHEMLTFVRDSGIPVIEHKSYYSFCKGSKD